MRRLGQEPCLPLDLERRDDGEIRSCCRGNTYRCRDGRHEPMPSQKQNGFPLWVGYRHAILLGHSQGLPILRVSSCSYHAFPLVAPYLSHEHSSGPFSADLPGEPSKRLFTGGGASVKRYVICTISSLDLPTAFTCHSDPVYPPHKHHLLTCAPLIEPTNGRGPAHVFDGCHRGNSHHHP